VLTQCTYAVSFLEKLKTLTGIKVPELNLRTWTKDLLDTSCCKDGDREVTLCGMWSLWNYRNDRRHGKSPIEPSLVVEWALEACFHLSTSSHTPEDGRRPTQQDERWWKPDEGFLKVNIDGAFCVGLM
jgi:hypothetical protein